MQSIVRDLRIGYVPEIPELRGRRVDMAGLFSVCLLRVVFEELEDLGHTLGDHRPVIGAW